MLQFSKIALQPKPPYSSKTRNIVIVGDGDLVPVLLGVQLQLLHFFSPVPPVFVRSSSCGNAAAEFSSQSEWGRRGFWIPVLDSRSPTVHSIATRSALQNRGRLDERRRRLWKVGQKILFVFWIRVRVPALRSRSAGWSAARETFQSCQLLEYTFISKKFSRLRFKKNFRVGVKILSICSFTKISDPNDWKKSHKKVLNFLQEAKIEK